MWGRVAERARTKLYGKPEYEEKRAMNRGAVVKWASTVRAGLETEAERRQSFRAWARRNTRRPAQRPQG